MRIFKKLTYFFTGFAAATALLLTPVLIAQPSESDLMGVGTPAALAALLGGNADYNLIPATDDTYDMGTASLEWQDAFFDGTVTTDAVACSGDVTLGTSSTITGTTSVIMGIGGTGQTTLTDGALSPTTDDDVDLGSASKEFKDAFFDGTVTLDALSMPISVVAGANTACSTTCTGFCFFGVNTAATEADIVNCADATADECLCVE
jgi:hypothetical protein